MVIDEPSFANVDLLNTLVKEGKLNHLELTKLYHAFSLNFRFLNIKEALVYTSLSQCQVWYTICRERKKKGK